MPAGDRIFWSDVADAIRAPLLRLVQQATQSLANATNVALSFAAGSEDIDTHNYHDVTTNNTRITPLKAGYWEFTLSGQMAASTALTILAGFIAKNGAAVQPFNRVKPAATNTTCTVVATAKLQMNGTLDYVEAYLNQTSGGALGTQASGGVNSVLEARYLGPV